MATRPKFLQKNGLTAYSLGCGNLQIVELQVPGRHVRLTLWHEGACYHVRAHDFVEQTRLYWVSEDLLSDARDQWRDKVKELFGGCIRAIKKDKRYTVTREHTGRYEDPLWVVRFCGEMLTTKDSEPAAWVAAYACEVARKAVITAD